MGSSAVSSSLSEQVEIEEKNQEINSSTIENLEPLENESISNGLENFAIEEETPELFNSESSDILENTDVSDKEITSFDTTNNQEEEDELEIPAFLRRQKN